MESLETRQDNSNPRRNSQQKNPAILNNAINFDDDVIRDNQIKSMISHV